uniref:PH domain-containing protein n=1 Tax=Roseihalotalea indica TaxID=2867963 RepID=A0AA49GL27_9BACT|nr:PH domain-containing protein [Tunicatimonas sp. TK19036]
MTFWSKRDFKVGVILGGVPLICLLLVFCLFLTSNQGFYINREQVIPLVILLLLVIITYYMWRNTFYRIEKHTLKYRVGFFEGSLDINSINSIRQAHYILAGNRPAMSLQGLLIRYNQSHQLYVSPKNEAEFINELQKVNHTIVVV